MSRAGTDRGGIRQKPAVDHAYNIPRLHKIFFWSALLSLLSIIWWVVDVDYDKPWKRFQRGFMRLQAEETRQAIAAEDKKLAGGSGKQKLDQAEAALQAANAEIQQRRADVDQAQQRLRRAENALAKVDAENRAARAEYDAFRYGVETTVVEASHDHGAHGAVEKKQEKLGRFEERRARAGLQFEEATAERDSAAAEVARLTNALTAAQKQREALFANRTRLEKRLEGVEFNVVNWIRNSPMMDFIAPSLKVQQTVHEDLRFEVNFQTIPRVDRCTTCHLGIDKAGYEDAPQPYTSHPNLDLFLSSRSPHPLEKVGCTVCHSGWDRSTDFKWAAHHPRNEEQAKQWERDYDWHPLHKWDWPMMHGKLAESQCYKCHKADIYLEGAPQLNQGREIFERAGCWGCHKLEGKQGPKVAPSLRFLTAKTNPDWLKMWLDEPTAFRPTTLMPRFFNLSNTDDEYFKRRNDVEITAITHYLFEKSESNELDPLPARAGDAARGRELVESVGCKACHLVGTEEKPAADTIRQQFGPNLMGLAAKTTSQWVYNWIRDPKSINPDTRMPRLRLTDAEALDITAYLMTLPAAEGFTERPVPESEPQLRDAVTLEYLQTTLSKQQAEIRISRMSEQDKMMFLGEKLVDRYGCYGCHDVPGFEKTEPIGTELTEEGSKITSKFDFGHVHGVPHTRADWIRTKLRDPRIWDYEVIKSPQDKLRMPQFNFTEAQIEAVTTFVLGLVREQVPAAQRKVYDPHEQARNAGMRLVSNKNCIACHPLSGFGGDYTRFVDDPALAPPLITPTGAKVQPEWLHDFLAAPSTIRPWLQVRMPTFEFTDEEISLLINMFQGISRVDERYPRFEIAAGDAASIQRGRMLFGIHGAPGYDLSLKCNSCHPAGRALPTSPMTQWGPNLALAPERLRADWVVDWMRNPAGIAPGTRMPNFFYDGDTPLTENPEQDMLDLRNYLWTLRDPSVQRLSRR